MGIVLNHAGEVGDFVSTGQFFSGHSAYECVAYSAALIRFCGEPNHGPTGNVVDVINTARLWYSREEGNDLASNHNGMSLQALYAMLEGLHLKYYPIQPEMSYIKHWLSIGVPVILCGDETGMYDVGIGDFIPYSWTPTGEHAIVASGIAPDGNLLIRDTANIGPSGLRPDPRIYDVSKMRLVSATAVPIPNSSINVPVVSSQPTQSNGGELPVLQVSDPMGQFFVGLNDHEWEVKHTNVRLIYAHLDFYRRYQGIFGIPLTNEIYLSQLPHTAIVVYERAIAIYDPERKATNEAPPGAESVYLMHIDSGIGQQIVAKPLLVELQKQVADLQRQIIGLEASKVDPQELQTAQNRATAYEAALKQVVSISQLQLDKAA